MSTPRAAATPASASAAARSPLSRKWRGCIVLGTLAALAIGTAGAQQVSPAEVLLFETDHLARMNAPVTLVYEFRKLSNVEPAFTDSVQLDVARREGRLHATLRFLTGERKHDLPTVDDARGNPVLLGFLEHDIAEMKRLTGGSGGYFRKRIRMALANGAQVTTQRITYGGKILEGKAVRIQPYLDDPLHARFEHYVRKTYTFVLSEGVPGGVYQLGTSLANGAGGLPGGAVVARRTASHGAVHAVTPPGALAPGVAKSGAASSGAVKPDAVKPGAAVSGTPAPAPAVSGTAAPAADNPRAPPPVIDETLTLVKVAGP